MAQRGLHSGLSHLDDATSVLLLAPSLDSREDEGCTDLLTQAESSRANVLSIAFGGSPDDRLDVWRRHVGEPLPDQTAVVSVGDGNRSVVGARTGSDRVDDQVTLEFVSDPGDLTGLGMRITERIEGWKGDGNQNVVCFHSLTALLQYADLERAYRFLHVLTGHFESSGTVAHFHMDPGAHDVKTVNTMKTLMDAVVEVDGDDWTVSTR